MDIVANKEHLTELGFYKILSIKSVFPKGLPKTVLETHPNIVSIVKPEYIPSRTLLNPYWIAGFVQADGTYGLSYHQNSRRKLGYSCQASFRVTQHERDLIVLQRIIDTLGCGKIIGPYSGRDR